MTDREDEALLRRWVDGGDLDAIEALLGRHTAVAGRIARRMLRNHADADDAVQMAFLRILQNARRYRPEASVRAWLLATVVNACRMRAREDARRSRRERIVRGAAIAAVLDGAYDHHDQRDAVARAIAGLPDRHRLPLSLHYGDGLPVTAIARALALPVRTVRDRLAAGREDLRRALSRARLDEAVSPAVQRRAR